MLYAPSFFQVLGAAACTVVSFDFSGSGMSEGDWVTLGYFEQHDVADVLAYLRSNGKQGNDRATRHCSLSPVLAVLQTSPLPLYRVGDETTSCFFLCIYVDPKIVQVKADVVRIIL